MLEEDKDLENFDDDEIEIDFDDEDAVDEEPVKDTEVVEEEKPDTSKEEMEALKKERDDLRAERDQIANEKADAEFKAKEANYVAVQGAINQWQSDIKKEKDKLSELEGDLEEARINGDADKAKLLAKSINEKKGLISHIDGEINKYSPLLVKPVREASSISTREAPAKQSKAETLADQWNRENSWYDDPRFSDKRKKAESLLKQLVADGYDPSTIAFWSHIDSELKSSGKKEPEKQRRTPPAVPPINRSGGTKQLTNKNKADEAAKKEAYAMLARRGIEKTDANYAKIRMSYYNTAKEFLAKGNANG